MPESAQSPVMVAQFGKYLLDAEIGRGGMARVYLARLRGLGGFEKRLVVKQVLPELARDPRFVQMFVDEAKTLVQMNHPHIVPVYELGIVDGVYFLAMEHVEGATLAQILSSGPLDPGHAAFVAAQVCDALHYAHTRFGLVHRDVTPRNIIVDGTGHVRLIDFGIAAPMTEEATEVLGSPGYMSPEHILAETVGPQSDLFSLGAVLFEALAGTPAFLRPDDASTRKAVLREDAPSLAGRPNIPAELVSIVDQSLRRVPAERPATAAVVGRKLRGLLAQLHPEGIAPEIGARAEAALKSAPALPRSLTSADANVRRDPSRQIRTIATSHALTEILEGTAKAATDERAGTTPLARREPSGDPESRTRRIDRTTSRSWAWVLPIVAIVAIAGSGIWVGGTSDDREARPPLPNQPPVTRAAPSAPAKAAPVRVPVAPALPAKAPAIAATSRLSINASPWATVKLDGRALPGETPHRELRVSAGDHVLEFECPPLGRHARVPFHADGAGTVSVFVDMSVDPPRPQVRTR